MYSSAWNWTAPTDKVFNGWYVVTSGNDTPRKYLSDEKGPIRVMPGDGITITYNQSESISYISYAYDSGNGVLAITTPDKSGLVLTLEALWDTPHYAYLSSSGGYSGSLDNPNRPYHNLSTACAAFNGEGTVFTNIVVLKTNFNPTNYSGVYNVTIDGTYNGSKHTLSIPAGTGLSGDIYFKNITLSTPAMGYNEFSKGLYANGHRLIIGEMSIQIILEE